jgi:putative oxidoreductase
MKDRIFRSAKRNYKPIIYFLARFILGGIFIYAAIYKIAFPRVFANVVVSYRLVPDQIAVWIAFFLPWIELGLGIAVIVGVRIREATIIICSLLVFFLAIAVPKSLVGSLKECGCFPKNSFLATTDIHWILVRDSVFLSFGILVLLLGGKKGKAALRTKEA